MAFVGSSRNSTVYLKRINNSAYGIRHTVKYATTVAATNENFNGANLSSAKSFDEIPGFKRLPLLGTGWKFLPFIGGHKVNQLHLAAKDKKRLFGDIVRDRFGHLDIVSLYKPEDFEMVFKNEGQFPSRGEIETLKYYRQSRPKWYTSTGVIVLQGQEWWDLRSKTQKHLMKPKAIQAFLEPMQDVARDFIRKVYNEKDANGEVPEFLKQLYKWALESVAYVGLDARLGCLDANLSSDSDGMKMIKSVQTQFECMNKMEAFTGNIQLWKIFPTPTWLKYSKEADKFTEIAFKYINRSLNELKKNAGNEEKDLTLLQSLLLTKGLDTSGAMVMVADMLMAGIDTTSHSVGYFLYNIAKNPSIQEKLFNEISTLLPSKSDRITPDVFSQLKFLKACIKESQRLTPIVSGVARKLDRDAVLSGYRVPAGAIVFFVVQETCIDPRFFPEPEKFWPERWYNKDEKSHPFAFLPFGFGTRSCIGRRLAELEIICLLTEMIRNFKVEYHHEDIGTITRLINTPDKPLRFNFIQR